MIEYLKVKYASLTSETKIIRKRERHILANARALSGIYVKKHGKGEAKPELPEKTRRAMELDDAAKKAQEAYDLFWGLTHHRKNVVRKEARDTHIALHFLKGKPYETVEEFAYTQPDWDSIERMVLKYGEGDPRDIAQRYEKWCQEASEHIEGDLFTRLKNPSNKMIQEQQARTKTIHPRKVA